MSSVLRDVEITVPSTADSVAVLWLGAPVVVLGACAKSVDGIAINRAP